MPEWDVYGCLIDDEPATILLDLQAADEETGERTQVYWVAFALADPDENGLAADSEGETLNALEDDLETLLAERLDAVYVGRITYKGQRRLFLYGPPAAPGALDEAMQSLTVAYSGYEFEFGEEDDPDWVNYHEALYPEPAQHQSMLNRRVVEQLEEAGDQTSIPREVDHWLYFPTAESRREFLEAVAAEGFERHEDAPDDADGEELDDDDQDDEEQFVGDAVDLAELGGESVNGAESGNGAAFAEPAEDDPLPFELHLRRTDSVDLDTIDDVVLPLVERAQALGGEYDGWETYIVSDGAEEGEPDDPTAE